MRSGDQFRRVLFVVLGGMLLRCGDSGGAPVDASTDATLLDSGDASVDGSEADAVSDAPGDAKTEPKVLPMLRLACWGTTRAPGYNLASGATMSKARAAIADVYDVSWDAMNSLDGPLATSTAAGIILTTYAGSFGTIVPALTTGERAALRAFVDAGHFAIILLDNDGYGGPVDPFNDSLATPFGVDAIGTFAPDGGFTVATPTDLDGGAVHPIFDGVPSIPQYFPGWLGPLADAGGVPPLVVATNPMGPAAMLFEKSALAPQSGVVVLFSDTGSFSDDVPGNLTPAAQRALVQTLRYAAGK